MVTCNFPKPATSNVLLSRFIDPLEPFTIVDEPTLSIYCETRRSQQSELISFLQQHQSDLEELLTEFEPLTSHMRQTIVLHDTNMAHGYNQNPGVPASTSHKEGTRDIVVRLDVGDVSSLCHELAHVVDASNPTFGYKSESDEFVKITSELQPRLEQVYQILRDADYDFEMDLSIEHETYALQPDELFAVVVSDWFRRTHEPNIFADCQVPLLSEMVVDNLHQHPNWSQTLQTYCEQLTNWTRPCRSMVSNTKLLSSEDIERIVDAIDKLSDLKEKIL